MQIDIVAGHHPPANPHGITVIIDVIRAFTTASYAFQQQAACIYPVATAEEAFDLKQRHPHALLVGEINALPIPGFDVGNSPWKISQLPLTGRTLIMRTTNGIAATLNARDSQQVLVAGLVNAQSTAAYIQEQQPKKVVLVASHPTGDEDIACAEYMRGLLGGNGISLSECITRTQQAEAAIKFLERHHPNLFPEDIQLAASSLGDEGRVMAVTFQPQATIRLLPHEQPML